jgi:hypothetical protein
MANGQLNVLPGGFAYSPLRLAASGIPFITRDTTTIGWCLDLLFVDSLSLLPSPRRKIKLALMFCGVALDNSRL